MKREIFRTAALNRMSSPEQLDQMLEVTSARSWIALAAVGFVLLVGLIWSFVGRIATKAPGRGVMIRAGNLMTVGSMGTGRVMSVMVHPGDAVHRGQVIAEVSQPLLEDKLDAARLDLEKMRGRLAPQANMSQTNLGMELNSIQGQRNAVDDQIATVQDEIKELNAQIVSTQELYDKGLVTRQQVTSLRERAAGLANQISQLRVQKTQLRGSAFKAQMSDKMSSVEAEARVRDAATSVHLLQADFDIASKVISPYDGEVVQVQALSGTLVGQGSTIVSLQPQSTTMEIISFVPATESKSIHAGMEVEIVPTNVRPEEYGFIRGRVEAVATYPATDQDLMLTFQNSSLTQMMTASGPVTEVRVQIMRDSTTTSGFLWSSKGGAPVHLTPGTICATNIITKEERPIRLLFPYIKAKLGMF